MKITAIVPWLVKVEASYWGEYLFVEVRTDDGLSGWGEITTTTKIANRAVAGMLRQLNELLVGDDPTQDRKPVAQDLPRLHLYGLARRGLACR